MTGLIFDVEKKLLVIEAKRRIDAINTDPTIRDEQRPGKLSGVTRWYRGALLLLATRVALDGMDVSRDYIRKWQLENFGRCSASKDLKHFAVTSRAGGGRAENNIPKAFAELIELLYKASVDDVGKNTDKFKQKIIIHAPAPLVRARRI